MHKLIALAALLLIGSRGLSADKSASTSTSTFLIDGFEKNLRWENKEWGDSAKLELSSDNVSEGKKALQASFTPEGSKGQKKFVIRRELGGKAHDLGEIYVDVFNPLPTSGVELALAIEADQYYETKPLALKAGWNKGLSFKIDGADLKSKASNWGYKTSVPKEVDLGSLIFLVHTGEANAGIFFFDNVRSNGKPTMPQPPKRVAAKIDAEPKLGEIKTLESATKVYEKMELGVQFEAPYHDPYEAKEILLRARFKAPSGAVKEVDGFLYDGKVSLAAPVEKPDWRLRFTPTEAGRWTYQIEVKNPKGSALSKDLSFEVGPATSDGFLRVDPKDKKYFSFDSGKFYYPIGQNAAWDSIENYQKMFASMKENGENWTRIWMAPWNFGIEWKVMGRYQGLGNYNLENAKKLDETIDLLALNGIYTQLVMEFHGGLSTKVNPEWQNNPYNKEQGGPLAKPQDFFTNLKARENFKKRLRYIIARWGYSPHIMAWEIFNEINWADGFSPKNDAAFHKDIGNWMREQDPYKRMITTSYYDYYNKATYELPVIDFTQYHAYQHRVWKTMAQVVPRFERFNKPFFFGEFGYDSKDGVDAQDKQGVFIHAGIWAQAMQPVAGNGMPWWWDTHIEPNQLYRHFGALAKFLAGIDRRGMDLRAVQESWPVKIRKDHKEKLSFYGLKNSSFAMGWICDTKGMTMKDRPGPYEFRGIQFYMDGFKKGVYQFETWDTYKGEVLTTEKVETNKKGRLLLSLPAFKNDVAFKLRAL